MSKPDLLKLAEQAFATGNNQQGLQHLRSYNQTEQATALTWHRQAVVEEQIGDSKLAGSAHLQSILLDSHNGVGYLYGGHWLESQQYNEAAAAAYSLAFELSPELHQPSNPHQEIRINSGANLVRNFLTNDHKKLCQSIPNCGRIQDAVWQQTDVNPAFETESFAPDLFYISEISQATFYDPEEFSWVKHLENNTNLIEQELNSALNKSEVQQLLRPYLPAGFQVAPELKDLVDSKQWRALDLYRDGQLNTSLAQYFENTLNLFKQVPTYNLEDSPFEVFFSVLQPHQAISSHFGQSNHALTAHLALEIPDNCYMQVGNDQQQWETGKLMIFDDSHLHSAHNNSDQQRIVLIFSIWHPDLSTGEQQAVQASFKHRQTWLANRYNLVMQTFESIL